MTIERPSKKARPKIERLRKICMSFPGVSEKLSHGEPTWFAKKVFVMVSDHHHDDRVGFWCPAPPGAQEAFVGSDPERFFVPPYVGGKGWLGVRLVSPLMIDPADRFPRRVLCVTRCSVPPASPS